MRRMFVFVLALALACTNSSWGKVVAVGLLACGGNCPVFLNPAFDVHVVDGSGNALCNATVVASGSQVIALQSFDDACAFHEASMAPPGTYVLTATAPGYSTQSQSVVVTKGDCGQDSSPIVTLTLLPAAP